MKNRWKGIAAAVAVAALVLGAPTAAALADETPPEDAAVVAVAEVAEPVAEVAEPVADAPVPAPAVEAPAAPVAPVEVAEPASEPAPVPEAQPVAEPATQPEMICSESGEGWSAKIDTTGDPATVTVTAEPGFLIDAYCVKAGTTSHVIAVEPPAATVVIDHPLKDSVSHYQFHVIPIPEEPVTTSLNPPVVKDLCETENDHYGLPAGSAGVTYSRDGLDIIATLAEGYTVTLVPEGWTADGEGVYRFAFDGEVFTDEPCETVVPVPALFAAEPTPPTCETAGSFDFSGTFPNVEVTVDPAYTGPGTYTLTVTAINGATFPDGSTVKTRTITVEGALGFQSTDPEADCYLDTPESITLGQPSLVDNCGTSSDGGLLPPEQTGVTYAWEDESDPDNWTIIATVAEGYVVSDASAGWVEGDGVYVFEWAPTFTNEACPTYPPSDPPTTPGKTTTPPALAVTGNGTNWMPWTLGALAMMLAGASAMGFRKVFNR